MLFRTVLALTLLVGCRTVDPLVTQGATTSDARSTELSAVTPAPGEWPFAKWRYARAYTFNFVPEGPGHQLSLYGPGEGWNESVRSRHDLDRSAAAEVAARVTEMKGTADLSKCAFPRHGFAFFDADPSTPVAVVSVCFTCEDIFVWPDYEMPFDERYAWDEETGWLVRGDAIEAAFRSFEALFNELDEPVWHDPRAPDVRRSRSALAALDPDRHGGRVLRHRDRLPRPHGRRMRNPKPPSRVE